jgi:hypothetical protein
LYDKYYNTETGLIPLAEKNFKDFLLDEYQKAADAQKLIEEKKANDLLGIEENYGVRLTALTQQRNNEINRLNFELFEANRNAALAQLNIDLNQALSRLKAINPFAKGNDIRDFYNELRGQISGTANPFAGTFNSESPRGEQLNPRQERANSAPSRFFQGTDYVQGNSGLDRVPAMLNVGERVIKASLNNRVRNVSNDELVNGYLKSQTIMPDYEYLMTLPPINSPRNDNSDVVSQLKVLSYSLKDLKQVNVIVENGVSSIEERTTSRTTKRIGQKLRG